MSGLQSRGVKVLPNPGETNIQLGPGIHKIPRPNPSPLGIARTDHVTRTRTGLREIKQSQIEAITNLAGEGHPVFRITFTDQAQMVLKAENVSGSNALTARRFNAVSATMSLVDPSATAEALSASELATIKQAKDKGTTYFKRCLTAPDTLFVWTKMNMLKRIKDFDVGNPNDDDDKAEMQLIMQKLKGNVRAWRSLGEVFAGDFFIGNGDRVEFDVKTRKSRFLSKKRGKIKSLSADIVNLGNIFFKFDKNGDIKKSLAIDNFDPNSEHIRSVMTDSDDPVNVKEWQRGPGELLKGKNKGARKQFANGMVDAMLERAQRFGSTINFDGIEATELAAGLESGIAKLKSRLVAEMNHKEFSKNVPEGIVKRMKFLRWI